MAPTAFVPWMWLLSNTSMRRGVARQPEALLQAVEQDALRGALGQPAPQRLARVLRGVLDDAGLGAALRHADLDPALGLGGERLLQQLAGSAASCDSRIRRGTGLSS